MILPNHKASLTICHNEHKDYYQTIEDLVRDHNQLCDMFKDDDSYKRCVATDEIWTMQWYPRTPISFYKIAAPTLEELLDLALEVEERDKK